MVEAPLDNGLPSMVLLPEERYATFVSSWYYVPCFIYVDSGMGVFGEETSSSFRHFRLDCEQME